MGDTNGGLPGMGEYGINRFEDGDAFSSDGDGGMKRGLYGELGIPSIGNGQTGARASSKFFIALLVSGVDNSENF